MKSSTTLARLGTLLHRSIAWQKEGWQAKSIGALGAPTGVRAVYVLMEREVS